jgi:hypothetical protein
VPQLKSSSKLLANPARLHLNRLFMIAGAMLAFAAVFPTSQAQERVNPTASAVKEFLDRAKAYVELQKKEDGGLPPEKPGNTTSNIEIRQRALAARMRLARPDAKPGDLFGSAAPIVRDIVVKDARSRAPKDRRAAMKEVPPQNPPKVNAEYPEKADLATVPPLLLTNLPQLPEGLEYRFMGRGLILRDTKANLIADFIPEAVPLVKTVKQP